jgi:hypothetical protein
MRRRSFEQIGRRRWRHSDSRRRQIGILLRWRMLDDSRRDVRMVEIEWLSVDGLQSTAMELQASFFIYFDDDDVVFGGYFVLFLLSSYNPKSGKCVTSLESLLYFDERISKRGRDVKCKIESHQVRVVVDSVAVIVCTASVGVAISTDFLGAFFMIFP